MQGAEVVISLPPEERRPRGLFTSVARQLPSLEVEGTNRLGLGVTHLPIPCTDSVAGPLDCDSAGLVFLPGDTSQDWDKSDAIRDYPLYADYDGTTDPGEFPWVRHNPFKIVDGLSCSNISLPTQNTPSRSLPNTLRLLAARSMSGMFTAELVTGEAGANRPLIDVATDLGNAATMAAVSVAVENHLADVLHGDRGVVIVPPGHVAAGVDAGWLIVGASSIETVTGHRVIADPGFLGDPANPKDVTPATVEIFAMGDVFFGSSGWRELDGALDLDSNRLNQIIETYAQLAYNPCAVGAVTYTG